MVLSKLVPKRLKTQIVRKVTEVIKMQRIAYEAFLPKVNLSRRHINNLKVLTNREELLEQLPKSGIMAEIGVDEGDFSQKILKICNPAKLHLIDVWNTDRYGFEKKQAVLKRFNSEIEQGIIEIHNGYSTKVANQFQERYFDIIYIDTDHSYDTTAQELKLFAPKMKAGGIIAGHDFETGNWISGLRYGVKEAVYEFCMLNDWEIIYLTIETDIHTSFALRKL
jgi:hypothetical protein